jgi:HNH endonuclease/uncharacterized protein DUF222
MVRVLSLETSLPRKRFRVHERTAAQTLIDELDAVHVAICARERQLFSLIVKADRAELWKDEGFQSMGAWVSVRYSITWWKANRWIDAAHALERLPVIAQAFAFGVLGVDKVVELTRFATPETEAGLISWATQVSAGSLRQKAELVARARISEVRQTDRFRSLRWWYSDEGRRFVLCLECPAHIGPGIISAIARETETIPVMPGEEHPVSVEARRADALMGILSARVAADPDPDRATVVVHVSAETLMGGERGLSPNPLPGRNRGPRVSGAGPNGPRIRGSWAEIDRGPVIHPETARRLACTARLQAVIEDACGEAVAMGRVLREPSAAMMRQLRHRDRCCVFCGSTRYLQAHHIRWWSRGGRTDLKNLILVCFFHHKLVHEYGWRVTRDSRGTVRWYHPDGTPYRAGPGPPAGPAPPGAPAEDLMSGTLRG